MKINKNDISSEKDIKLMVNTFYDKVNKDTLLSYVFNDFSKVDWNSHLPKMYGFWNTLIFAKQEYKGSPFAAHIDLPIQTEHFDRWITLFEETLDQLFEGEITEKTKLRANSIAQVFQHKLQLK